MPKIFVLRHQLAEQQAKLRQHDKQGENSSPPLSSDEEAAKEALIQERPPSNHHAENRPEILSRPPPGLVIQPIPAPIPIPTVQTTGKKMHYLLV